MVHEKSHVSGIPSYPYVKSREHKSVVLTELKKSFKKFFLFTIDHDFIQRKWVTAVIIMVAGIIVPACVILATTTVSMTMAIITVTIGVTTRAAVSVITIIMDIGIKKIY